MLKQLIVVWVVVAAGIAISAALVPSVEIDGGVGSLLGIALLFGSVNTLIVPLLRLISLPLTAATLGLVGLVISGALLGITAALTDALDVGGVLSTSVAAVVISAVTASLMLLVARVFAPEMQ